MNSQRHGVVDTGDPGVTAPVATVALAEGVATAPATGWDGGIPPTPGDTTMS
jgi:hypothetical protein